jgi:L-threonylcarbamoyladenylate synthase
VSARIGKNIAECVTLLNTNELVAMPTETVYGLAANGLNAEAVAKIFEVKNRPFFDPLILHTYSFDQISSFVAHIPVKAKLLAKAFWPGPMTLVLAKKACVPDITTSGLTTVGVRVPNHKLTLELLAQLEFPLAAPSANPFKYISPTSAAHVYNQLGHKIEYILDGGNCEIGVESTIIGFDENENPVIYRLGGLEIEKIEAVVGSVKMITNNEENPSAPGMLKLHYSPTKKLFIDSLNANQKIGLITFNTHIATVAECKVLSAKGSLNEAANKLFATMRELDEANIDVIVAEQFPNLGLGRAINDRLNRASTN